MEKYEISGKPYQVFAYQFERKTRKIVIVEWNERPR